MRILDVSAGNRAIWFDKHNPLCTFVDIRASVWPDLVRDSRDLSVFSSGLFDLAVFDPPHVNTGKTSKLSRNHYGAHTTAEIRSVIQGTAKELWRVLKPDGLLAFKWNDHDQKLGKILALLEGFEPLFGNKIAMRTKHASATYWVVLRRQHGG